MSESSNADPDNPDPESDGRNQNDATIDNRENTRQQPEPTTFHRDASLIAGEAFESVGEGTGEFPAEPAARESTSKAAVLVGAGILISRIVGVIRQRVFAHYFGISDAAGAFNAAFRIPNFLQNVFGEGALSASFIPVYANLLARGDKKEASRVADAVLTQIGRASCRERV